MAGQKTELEGDVLIFRADPTGTLVTPVPRASNLGEGTRFLLPLAGRKVSRACGWGEQM